jgi:hypothetical protein
MVVIERPPVDGVDRPAVPGRARAETESSDSKEPGLLDFSDGVC